MVAHGEGPSTLWTDGRKVGPLSSPAGDVRVELDPAEDTAVSSDHSAGAHTGRGKKLVVRLNKPVHSEV